VLTAIIDFGLDTQQPAEMPCWTSNVPGQHANWPHDGEDALTIERRFPEAVRSELQRRGRPVRTIGDLEGPCSVEIICRDAATARGACPAPARAATAGPRRGEEASPLRSCPGLARASTIYESRREYGRGLGLPDEFVARHPFPGPGLTIRIPGDVTCLKLDNR
jgi:hypothetical protein